MTTSDILPTVRRAGSSALTVTFAERAGATGLERLYESGSLRLRRLRGTNCEAAIVATAGGIVAGDDLAIEVRAGPRARATVTTVAAEKVYRSSGVPARIATRIALSAEARLVWVPQETILFDGARLDRRLEIDVAADAELVAAEMLVFGRLASGERAIRGTLRDDWRLRRDGRLVFAEATRLDGAIGATLDRPALGGGARAAALVLVAAPDAEARVEPLRAAFTAAAGVEAGVSARDGIVLARALARSPERLRTAIVAALDAIGAPPPRTWL